MSENFISWVKSKRASRSQLHGMDPEGVARLMKAVSVWTGSADFAEDSDVPVSKCRAKGGPENCSVHGMEILESDLSDTLEADDGRDAYSGIYADEAKEMADTALSAIRSDDHRRVVYEIFGLGGDGQKSAKEVEESTGMKDVRRKLAEAMSDMRRAIADRYGKDVFERIEGAFGVPDDRPSSETWRGGDGGPIPFGPHSGLSPEAGVASRKLASMRGDAD